jgi:protein-S-isoprenylcysteine O-methyltransferase Ste14
MRGTDFEFRYRFWFILLIFFLAFGSYFLEPRESVEWLLKLLGLSGGVPGVFPAVMSARVILAIGALFVGAAALVRTWGTAYLREDVVHDKAVRADRLVADGPYRCVRNPLYFGNMLLALGFCPMAPPIGCVVLVAGMGLFVLRLIGREEAFLLEKQGDAYRAYLERVPRLWPALRPRLPAGGVAPRWGQAWAAEMWMWILFASCAVFVIKLNPKLLDIMIWGGFAVYFLIRAFMKRRTQRDANVTPCL